MSMRRKIKRRSQPSSVSPSPALQHNREQARKLYLEGRFSEALVVANQVLATSSPDVHLLNLTAVCHLQLGNAQQAISCWQQAIAIQPDFAEAHYNLGNHLHQRKHYDAAETAYRQAITHQPHHCDAIHNLGNLLKECHRYDEAEAAYRHVLTLKPNAVDTRNNLGNLLKERKRYAEAEATYRQVLHLRRDHTEAHYNLGNLLSALKRFAEAEAAYKQALHFRPDFADARLNLGLLLLSQGRFQEGWPLHEARQSPDCEGCNVHPIHAPFPMWQGEPLTGKSLLMVSEQGFGDQIQFCRYTALLRAKGVHKLTILCSAPLKTLFASLDGVDQVLAQGATDPWPPHDFWVFYLSIPHHLGTTFETIPAQIPYLRAAPERRIYWQNLLPQAKLRVGLVWKGRPTNKNDPHRSLPSLKTLAPLWSVPGITFISLQKGNGEEEAQNPPSDLPILPLGASLQDFADTAAVVSHLDLVISIDSAVAHLAGALGKPCWILIAAAGTDWRWMHDRCDSPWYPGVVRLFRQTTPDHWSDVVQHMVAALQRWVPD
ncbi:MAG: glycosyltransferase family protein [Magnetococcales bacterium]|nr:glycosyltransferase family protein [Magnetococcales bacterium]